MPEPASLQPGQRFGNGRFVLVRFLGRGGMGEVWLAQDERLHEPVALKFLPAEIRRDPVALDDMRRETARSHRLSHANIVRIHDLHEDADGTSFIVMEYIDGPTVAALRVEQPNRVFAWAFLRPLLEQLCAALDYAHGEKVIHRDLKPANMMVDARGRLKLADFGIAAVVSDSMSRVSAQRTTSGTLPYMSPQQLTGKRPQPTDDIYSLGATLYELLTSKPPFYSGDLTHQLLHEPPEPMDERLAGLGIENEIPPDVAALVMACLAKEPAQRPQSALAVAEWIGLEVAPKPSLTILSRDVFSETLPATQTPGTPGIEAGGNGSGDGSAFAGPRRIFLWIGGIVVGLLLLGGGWFWRTHLTAAQSRAWPPLAGTKGDRRAMQYGLFIHWGLLTFTGDPYREGRTKDMGQISPARFAPTGFDPRQWARAAKDAGMDFAMLNAKFEDGFALWPSKYSDYSVANSASGTDVVAQFIAACNAEEVAPGIFYSLIDAHNEGEFRLKGPVGALFFAVVKRQLVELLTNYPGIRLLAIDLATKLSKSQFDDLCSTVRQLNPQCLILGDQKPPMGQNFRFETVIKSWFWQTNAAITPVEQIFDKYSKAMVLGRPFLLSVGPDQAGRIPEDQIASLMEMRKLIEGGNGPTASSNLKRGLVLYYSFDEPPKNGLVRDDSGSGNNGQVVGATWTSQGRRGGAFQFHRDGDYITVSNTAAFNLPTITAAAWIKTSYADPIWRTFVDKYYRSAFCLCIAGDWDKWNPSNRYRGYATMEWVGAVAQSDNVVADGNWHYLAGVADGSKVKLYVDGRLQRRTANQNGKVAKNDYPLFIGCLVHPDPKLEPGQPSIDGLIDEITIYNRALSDDEIRQLYESYGGAPAQAAVSSQDLAAPAHTAPDDWITLFDGHSVDTWMGTDSSTFPSQSWEIKDGVLKNIPDGPKICLYTREKFRDFELEFEWRIDYGGNSGVFYSAAKDALHREFQLMDDNRMHFPKGDPTAPAFPEDETGALWGVIAPATDKLLRPDGEWNQGKLLVKGRHVEHWINGRMVVEYELGSAELEQKIARSPRRSISRRNAQFSQPGDVPIGLQTLLGGVSFRNIRIRRLADAASAPH